MEELFISIRENHIVFAILFSLLLSIIISIGGIIPSAFLTAANVAVFGFWGGFWLSFIGEAIGAIVAFYLYRLGFQKWITEKLSKYPLVKKVQEMTGLEALGWIFLLRLTPFVPSGLVTFAAAIGSVTPAIFLIGSSLGKIPALFIEVVTVYGFVYLVGIGTAIQFAIIAAIVWSLYRYYKKKKARTS